MVAKVVARGIEGKWWKEYFYVNHSFGHNGGINYHEMERVKVPGITNYLDS